jgi:hypothetical protein
MATIIVQVTPTDYAAWHEVHMKVLGRLQEASVTSDVIYRSLEDPRKIVVIQEVGDLEKFQAWVSSPEAQSIIASAPIEAPPVFLAVEEIDRPL